MWRRKRGNYINNARPGIITGAADNDPAGISSYSIAGSQFGYSLNWLMILAIPMLIAVQGMVARIGDITKAGLSEVLEIHFGKYISYIIIVFLITCNTATIGADMLATASAINTLITPFYKGYQIWTVLIFILIVYILIFKNYKKIATYIMIGSLAFLGYVITAIITKPELLPLIKGTFVPNLGMFIKNRDFALVATGILGTTISPYLLFWQEKEEVEERRPLFFARKERMYISMGFIFSQLVTLFIMTAAGATLFVKHINILNSQFPAVTTASVLKPIAGAFASQLFSIGIISSGLIAIPILASSSAYAITDLTKRKGLLSSNFKNAKLFYYIIILSLLSGIIFAIFKVNTIKALFYSQVLDGVITPIIVILILIIANKKSYMGKFVNNLFDNIFTILSIIVMVLAAIFMFL